MSRRIASWSAGVVVALGALARPASAPADDRQSRDDAWWTGPLLAASAATLPQGHWLFEPYLFNVITTGSLDAQGHHHPATPEHDFGSQSYIIYGVTDRLAIAALPRFAFNEPAGGPDSSHIGLGDLTVQAQYGLTSYHEGSYMPAMSVVLAETFPTGEFDHLERASDAFGAGVFSTALSLYTQDYFWLPNGRILRARLDLTYQVSRSGGLEDASAYGTPQGFRGRVYPGDAATIDLAGEYSLTRSWVLALDLIYQHQNSTRVAGVQPPAVGGDLLVPFETTTGAGESYGFAPAVEYSWSAKAGVIAGVRIIPLGRNTNTTITPAVAVNLVF
jgi:hypothetical protein